MTPLIELIIGYAAALLVSLLQLPQVYKTYQIKSADELSIYMILLNFLASILWLVYGIILDKPPIYITRQLCIYTKGVRVRDTIIMLDECIYI